MSFELISHSAWFVVFTRFLLAILVLEMTVLIIAKIKTGKIQIAFLNGRKKEAEERKNNILFKLKQRGVELTWPDQELHGAFRRQMDISHPHLEEFVKEAGKEGLSDKEIKDELKKAYWSDAEISQVMKL